MSNGLTQQHNAKSLLVFAFPTIIMMVFMSLYTMVDGIFVANFVSADALAGLNLVIPALSALVSLSVIDAGIPLTDAVKMGTLTPARIVGEEKRIGSLEVGKCADICILDGNFELLNLVLNGRKVR